MNRMNASQLIELLARHITEHGNARVVMPREDEGYGAIVRCWWDSERECIVVEGLA